ncbi:styrene monooxygenase/indole monooxygenase family protein [Paraburkholderia strydomiana]|uniref:styrene monooxygenase/indole monooxygenase family protein n=1 Tax=Paraburkholderia strydomiana TaxID=1245417 RepID=UPI00286CF026|nr:styrene monooxygenase/indole monooxygenase family protein [Paraburkholderia strydomiana]
MALGLLDRGYRVTLVTNRDSDAIVRGRVMSSQCMFGEALRIERDLGSRCWDSTCPTVDGIGLAVAHPEQPGRKVIDWAARLNRPAMSVDQRIKMSVWLNDARSRGAEVELREAGVPDLESLTASHDLVLVSAGKGSVADLFLPDPRRTQFHQPQRTLACTYLHGLEPTEDFSRVAFSIVPGVGECVVFPALTVSGPCHIVMFEGIPGGPMDCFNDMPSPKQHLERSRALLKTYLPWEYARCSNVQLTDEYATLSGRFTPCVRQPVATLPSGRHVLGMADSVVLNDPITGQGANSAAKCCEIYLDSILRHGDGPFSADWMLNTFERYWDYAQYVVQWTNTMLMPRPAHILKVLAAAGEHASLASSIANSFDDPREFFPWWIDASESERCIAAHSGVKRAGF